jgi:plasmid stabilization system protein ParE
MRVRWSKPALADLRDVRAWLDSLPNSNPKRVIGRIRASADLLAVLGDVGRPSGLEGLRELSVRDAPYVLVFRKDAKAFVIVALFHMAEDR